MEINDQIIATQYESFLVEITNLVQDHRVKAVQSVQTISNTLYWSIGELILKKQEEFGWGKSIVELLSNDLTKTIGKGISWSPRNLWFMRQLVNEYSNLNQVDSDLKNIKNEQLKQEDDKPTIGILLVPEKNHLEVEYALRSVNKPIGVSEYILSKKPPEELEGKLPTTEQFKNILNE